MQLDKADTLVDDAAELKKNVQAAWNFETRVLNYVSKVALREFADGGCRDAWRQILKEILPARRLRILDMGCGPGMFAQVCAELGHEVTGADFSERMIATAKSLAADRRLDCRFVYGDAEEPPFPPQSFDVVLSRRLLFNLPNPERAFAAWRDLVVPGGLVISMDSDPAEMPAAIKTVRRWLGLALARLSGYREPPQPYRIDPQRIKIPHERFPLIKSPSSKVRPIMERLGFAKIELIYADEIRRQRQRMEPLIERLLKPASRPYIMIGHKANG
jgi:ubiquinone/menaquinone biosynthesis C-methylase UbiE